jgi:hypothetical protein
MEKVPDFSEGEKEVSCGVLRNREAALAWSFEEIGKGDPLVQPPVEFKTVPYRVWQRLAMRIELEATHLGKPSTPTSNLGTTWHRPL